MIKADTKTVQRALLDYAKQYDQKTGTSLLAAGAYTIRNELRKAIFNNQKIREYKRYSVYPGNLSKSQRVYKSKSAPRVYVGPYAIRRISSDKVGTTFRNASGYYAAALAGNATLYRQKFMEPIANAVTPQAVANVEKAVARFHNRQVTKIF